MKHIFKGFLVVALALAFMGCKDNNNLEELRKSELRLLETFVEKNYPNEEQKPSGLYFISLEEGIGDSILQGDRVQIHYATWLIDSTLIDQSSGYLDGLRYEPLEFVPGNSDLVQGLQEAVTYMKPGGKANLIIPSEIAYGQNGQISNGIPGFATLLMQIEIYKVYPLIPTSESE